MTVRDTRDEPVYDFEHLGEKLAETLMRAAEDQVTEAQNIYKQTEALAEGIRAQVLEQSKTLEDINRRLKSFGVSMLEAHRKFAGGLPHALIDSDEHKVLNLHDRQITTSG